MQAHPASQRAAVTVLLFFLIDHVMKVIVQVKQFNNGGWMKSLVSRSRCTQAVSQCLLPVGKKPKMQD